ncbi:Alpha/Beta hydrolase protein [Infundibulicybe gibba]|nr:Alpha/Beta hydrolase protein [Infundibulicybe gibba]
MYKQLTEIPIPRSAQFLEPNVIQITSSTTDHIRNEKRTISKTISLGSDIISAPQYQDRGEIVAALTSPSYRHHATLIESKASGKTKRFVEVWQGSRRVASKDVSEVHDAFYTDEHLASLCFSASEGSLLYTAEAKVPDDKDDPFKKFRYVPQLGEGIAGKRRPTIYILDWESSAQAEPSLTPLSVTSPILLGQAIFSHDSNRKIYATGYEYLPDGRLLGVKGCTNRPSGIWEISLSPTSANTSAIPCDLKKLTPTSLSCRSPRLVKTPAGDSILLWLSCPTGGPHAATSTLHSLNVTPSKFTGSIATIVDTVFQPTSSGFPGLYPDLNLPPSTFVELTGRPEPSVVFHSLWGSRSTVLLVSLDGQVEDITPNLDGKWTNWTVLTSDGHNRIVCARSTPASPAEIVLGKFDDSGSIQWRLLEKPNLDPQVEKRLSDLQASVHKIPNQHPTESIVIQRKNSSGKKDPCITFIHGGPHTTTTTAFTPLIVALALEGYTISMPNYTGSLGFGESVVRALIGQCGRKDVDDCIASARHMITLGIADEGPKNQMVMGGSHGGFLSAHLIGQFPNFFGAAVIRNPVISLGEISTSDLPDWHYAELGLDFPLSSSPTDGETQLQERPLPTPFMDPAVFQRLYKSAPVQYINAITAHVLLLIGEVDQRASPTQGVGLYHALKGRKDGKGEVEMLLFPGESHALEGVECARVWFSAAIDWFKMARA